MVQVGWPDGQTASAGKCGCRKLLCHHHLCAACKAFTGITISLTITCILLLLVLRLLLLLTLGFAIAHGQTPWGA